MDSYHGLRAQMSHPEATAAPLKQWVVSAMTAPKQPLVLHCAGRPLNSARSGGGENVSPVEYMLLAIAGCFALSCAGALKARESPPTPVEVVVTGEKAPDAPSRVHRIALAVAFGGGMSEAEAVAIAREAKHLCTVTNTIFGAPIMEVTASAAS